MILLRSDCLVFKTASGEHIPCSAQEVTVHLTGDAKELLDEELLNQATQAVLHYFRTETGQTVVTLSEFSLALEKVLRGFGFEVKAGSGDPLPVPIAESDLETLAAASTPACELVFFEQLRAELRRHLHRGPQHYRFTGLRGCVKRLTGAKRWSRRCQVLSDQIVDYLRQFLGTASTGQSCTVMVL